MLQVNLKQASYFPSNASKEETAALVNSVYAPKEEQKTDITSSANDCQHLKAIKIHDLYSKKTDNSYSSKKKESNEKSQYVLT